MSNAFRKINRETVNHIKYRNTVMTGEVTAVNPDGTYNVKISQASGAYPDVETLDYNANFSVGEIVDIAFEYGNRELPKIMGTAKKIAQEPSSVETDYSTSYETIDIDIGSQADSKDLVYANSNVTFIDGNNPANACGIITQIELWLGAGNIGGNPLEYPDVKVATVYEVGTNTFTVRDYADLGTVYADIGSTKQTFNVDIDVVEGDYIAISWGETSSVGNGMGSLSDSGLGYWIKTSTQIPFTSEVFTLENDNDDSLCLNGTGTGSEYI